MVLSQLKNVNSIYLVTENEFIIDFFQNNIKGFQSLSIHSLLPREKMAFGTLVVFDASILENAPSFMFFQIEHKDYVVLCFETPGLSDSIKYYIERKFSYILPFPLYEGVCINYLNDKLEISYKDDDELCYLDRDSQFTKSPSLCGYFQGDSNVMKTLRTKIEKIASSSSPVLLIGESGTGKSTGAKVIHNLSGRKNHKMYSLNVSTVNDSIACSTFFGTKNGAYTDAENRDGLFKVADKGTVFIDEIGSASMFVQKMFLTFMDTGNFQKVGSDSVERSDIRLLFATNENLNKMQKEGTFRFDFFSRICANVISFPSLRQRKEDIPCIINSFFNDKRKSISDDAVNKLMDYNWPGNIRELQHCLERAVNFSSNDVIKADDLEFDLLSF